MQIFYLFIFLFRFAPFRLEVLFRLFCRRECEKFPGEFDIVDGINQEKKRNKSRRENFLFENRQRIFDKGEVYKLWYWWSCRKVQLVKKNRQSINYLLNFGTVSKTGKAWTLLYCWMKYSIGIAAKSPSSMKFSRVFLHTLIHTLSSFVVFIVSTFSHFPFSVRSVQPPGELSCDPLKRRKSEDTSTFTDESYLKS